MKTELYRATRFGVLAQFVTTGLLLISANAFAENIVHSMPTTGIIGLGIVAVACIIAGAFIILRRG